MDLNLRTVLILLSVLFFLFAGFPPAPQRLAVNWQWWGVAMLVAALWLVSGSGPLIK